LGNEKKNGEGIEGGKEQKREKGIKETGRSGRIFPLRWSLYSPLGGNLEVRTRWPMGSLRHWSRHNIWLKKWSTRCSCFCWSAMTVGRDYLGGTNYRKQSYLLSLVFVRFW